MRTATALVFFLSGCSSAAAPFAPDSPDAAPVADAAAPPDASVPQPVDAHVRPAKVGDACDLGAAVDECRGIPAGCWREHTPSLPTDMLGRCTHTCTGIPGAPEATEEERCADEGGRCLRYQADGGGEAICVPR